MIQVPAGSRLRYRRRCLGGGGRRCSRCRGQGPAHQGAFGGHAQRGTGAEPEPDRNLGPYLDGRGEGRQGEHRGELRRQRGDRFEEPGPLRMPGSKWGDFQLHRPGQTDAEGGVTVNGGMLAEQQQFACGASDQFSQRNPSGAKRSGLEFCTAGGMVPAGAAAMPNSPPAPTGLAAQPQARN